MTEKKKILVLIGSLDVGGAEMDIVRNYPLINKTHDVLLSLYSHRGPLASQIEEAGVKVISRSNEKTPIKGLAKKIATILPFLPFTLLPFLKEIIEYFLFIRRVVIAEKPDIIHAFLPLSYVLATFVRMSVRSFKPLLIMSRLSLNFYFAKHPLLGIIEKMICHKFVDIAVGNSKAILENLREEGVREEKLFLLYNGIDVDAFKITRDIDQYLNAKTIQITSIGNLFTYKGHGDLLAALEMLKTRRPDLSWNVNIIGRDQNDNLAKYNAFLRDNNLENSINFVGASNEIATFLAQSHLHIHPSHTEGLPNSIIEAMSSGLACIGTNVGGVPELIDHKKTGLIVESKSPDDLSIAIESMLDDRKKLYDYGRAGQKKAVKLFSLKQSIARYLELYIK